MIRFPKQEYLLLNESLIWVALGIGIVFLLGGCMNSCRISQKPHVGDENLAVI